MNLTINETLKIERLRRRITQARLAQYLGIDPSCISRIESGAWHPSEQTVRRVRAAMDALTETEAVR